MDTRVALLGIIVQENVEIEKLNHVLSQYGEYIVGRMGIPYKQKGIFIISIAIDAPEDVISALSGKIGMLQGITSKVIYGRNEKT